MFVVYVGSILTTLLWLQALRRRAARRRRVHPRRVALWLWFTVLFANFAEAMAEGRGKAQADALRKARRDVHGQEARRAATRRATYRRVAAADAAQGRRRAGRGRRLHPRRRRGDRGRRLGRRERDHRRERAGHPRERRRPQRVTGGTRVLSDWLVVRITANPGESVPRPHDRAWSKGPSGRRRPTRSRSTSCWPALTIIFLLAMRHAAAVLASTASRRPGQGTPITVTVLVALLVCLIPTTIGGLLSAIGIAGMDRMIQANVIAMSGRAVEAAGDVDVLLLDKTGTITLGNRQAIEFIPADGVDEPDAGRRGAARLAGRRDAGGPQHRRAGQGEVRPPRARRPRARRRRSCPSRPRRA